MLTTILILSAILANMLIGSFVFCMIDDDEQSLLKWFKSCPAKIAWFACPIVLNLWPVGVLFWLLNNSKTAKG